MPLIVSDSIVLGDPEYGEIALPLSHPRLLYHDIVATATVTSTSEEYEFPIENVQNYLTWDYWRPDTAPDDEEQIVLITTEEAVESDYLMIVAHTFGTNQNEIVYEYHDGSNWVELMRHFVLGDDTMIVLLHDTVFASQRRIRIESGDVCSIGVIMAGHQLAVERKLYRDHVPITLGAVTTKLHNKSEGGHFLGTSIRREGVATVIKFKNLSAEWVRSHFQPFIEAAKTHPFGWAWRPDTYPNEIAYVFTDVDIHPVNTGPRDLMAVEFPVEGIVT